jgi:hypothetical protein
LLAWERNGEPGFERCQRVAGGAGDVVPYRACAVLRSYRCILYATPACLGNTRHFASDGYRWLLLAAMPSACSAFIPLFYLLPQHER